MSVEIFSTTRPIAARRAKHMPRILVRSADQSLSPSQLETLVVEAIRALPHASDVIATGEIGGAVTILFSWHGADYRELVSQLHTHGIFRSL